MKKQGNTAKYTGDERVHDATSIFKKFFEGTKKTASISTEAVKTTSKAISEQTGEVKSDIFTQITGIELTSGKSHSISHREESHGATSEKHDKAEITSEHMNYFAEFKSLTEGKKTDETTMTIKHQLDSILAELRNLKNSSDELQSVFKDVVVDAVPEKPGVYHLTFYEGFLKLVLKMRDKVEDGVLYAKMFKSRKGEKSYSSMAKKGGTSFTQHHDRAVATQTG